MHEPRVVGAGLPARPYRLSGTSRPPANRGRAGEAKPAFSAKLIKPTRRLLPIFVDDDPACRLAGSGERGVDWAARTEECLSDRAQGSLRHRKGM